MLVGTLWDKLWELLLEGLDHHQQTDGGGGGEIHRGKTKRTLAIGASYSYTVRRIAFSVRCIVEPDVVALYRNFGLPHTFYLGGGIGGSSSREISSDDEKTECSPRLPFTGGLD